MFLTEKQLIDTVVKQSLRSGKNRKLIAKDLQTMYAFMQHFYVAVAVSIGALITVVLVQILDLSHALRSMVWAISIITMSAILFYICTLLVQDKERISVKHVHRYMLASSFVLGMMLSYGVFEVVMFYGLPATSIHFIALGYFVLLLICQNIAIGVLAHKLSYFFLFFFASILAFIVLLAHEPSALFQPPYVFGYGLIYVGYAVAASIQQNRARLHSINLIIKNNELLNTTETQKIQAEEANQQLKSETQKLKSTENLLSLANQQLEQKVKQRTHHISQINKQLSHLNESLKLAHESASMASWEWQVDSGAISADSVEPLIGYSSEELNSFGKNFITIIHPDDVQNYKQDIVRHLKGELEKLEMIFRLRHADSHWIWVKIVGRVRKRDPDTGRVKTLVGICQDISLEKSITDSLSLSNKVFEESLEAIFILDNNLNYISVNPSFEKITGYPLEEVEGKPIFFNESKHTLQSNFQKVLIELKVNGFFVGEIAIKNKDGDIIHLQLSINQVKNDKGDITNYIGISSDVTQRAKDRERLSYLASYDALTDLPNRKFFNQQLHTLLTQNREKFAVIRINIDRFRMVNNSIGSKNADKLLKKVAFRLSQIDHPVRALARIAGDDFAVLFNQLSLNNLKSYLDTLLETFVEPFFIDGHEVNVRVSAGVSLFPQHGHQVDTLLNRAEQGLKRAKANGGHDYFIYNQGLHVSSLEKLQLENDLRKAIQHKDLIVYYQPKINLGSGRLAGFEALVRWHHPQRGLLAPKEFIDMAEESGLIGELGFEVLTQTCRQIHQWQKLGMKDMRVAVNVEAQQLKRGNFLGLIDTALMDANISGNLLEIEITESSLMDLPEKISPLLESVKSRGITVALDDFGTGYSSLSYLSQYPFDAIKIDRSFVASSTTKEVSAGIVRAIIAMGQSLGVQLIAEGVENQQHEAFLKQAGCHFAQGYYYSKPVDATSATKLLQQALTQQQAV